MRAIKSYLFLLTLLSPSFANALGVPELIKGALNYHPSISQQKDLRAANLKGLEAAKWEYFPTPSISLDGVDASKEDPNYAGKDDYAIRLGLSQPLYTGGKIAAGVQSVEAGIASSDASLTQTYEDVSLQIVEAYGNWLTAHLTGLAQAKSIAVHEKLKKQVERRTEAGIATVSDLLLAKGRLQSNYADAATVISSEAIALTSLEALFGRPITAEELRLSEPFALKTDADVSLLEQVALANNPAILLARADILAADADTKLQKSALKPEVSLRFEHQRGNTSIATSRHVENRLFLSVGSTLGAGLSSYSTIEESLIRKNAVLSQLASTEIQLRRTIQSDYALLQSFQTRINALEESLETAIKVSDSYNRQFLVGRKSWLDVMNTARDLIIIETQLVNAKSAEVVVSWRLYITALGLDAALAEAEQIEQDRAMGKIINSSKSENS